jgi:hypothetical protein
MSPQNLTLVNSIIEKDTSGGFVPERTLLLLQKDEVELIVNNKICDGVKTHRLWSTHSTQQQPN